MEFKGEMCSRKHLTDGYDKLEPTNCSGLTRFEFTFLTPCVSEPERFSAKPNTFLLAKEKHIVAMHDVVNVPNTDYNSTRVTFHSSILSDDSREDFPATAGKKHFFKSREEIIARLLFKEKRVQKKGEHQHIRFPVDDEGKMENIE